MRIVEIIKDFQRGVSFKKGHKYVMAEDVESQLRSLYGSSLGMSFPIDPHYRKYKGEDLTNKKIIIWRTGGIGDVGGFLNPVFRYLKSRYENCFIRVATGCKEPLLNLPEIDELYDMPFDAKLLEDADFHMQFQGIIEGESEKSKTTHAVDMFFSYFSIDSTQFDRDVKKPRLVFTEKEMEWRRLTLEKLKIIDEDYVIGIQVETSAPLRNFPKDKFKAIIDVLAQEQGVKIVLIGAEQQRPLINFLKGNYENVINSIGYNVREAIILVTRYDLVISPDTFMVQIAGALDKPQIGLYGPFPSEVRMKYFNNAIALEPDVVCSPCYKHDFRACIKGFPSPCFSLIKNEDVLQAANYLRHKSGKGLFGFMKHFLKQPHLEDVEKYMLGADKGLCFFPGYYNHPNTIRVDTNHFVNADITDLSAEFKRSSYPFVLYMNDFSQNRLPIYQNSKNMVRPGGFFIAYKDDAQEQFYNDLKIDIGKSFVLLYSKFDPVTKTFAIVGKKRY